MTLIDRLSKLDGPCKQMDRDIDAFIWFGHHGSLDRKAPAYTASVDAAIALAERVLPGCCWTISNNKRYEKPFSEIILTDANGRSGYCGLGASPAIALCIALLRAKEASHGE